MFQTIYLKKWTDNFPSIEILDLAIEQWRKGLSGIDNKLIEKAVDYCRINLIWPPSIAELISFCEKEEGIPDCEEAFFLAIRREYTHSLVELVAIDVGSWAMSNDSEKVLRKKFKAAYDRRLKEYRTIKNSLRIE